MCIPVSTFLRLTAVTVMAAVLALLTGCATDQPTPVLPTTITKLQLVHPAASLLADCPVHSTPPDPDTFAAKQLPTEVERLRFQLGLVTDYASALQTDLKDCRARPKVLRDWFADEDKLYPATP